MTSVRNDQQPAPAAHSARKHAPVLALAFGALGVVFGDIGTSPLYALQTVFSIDNGAVRPVSGDVYGVISLVFWSILLIVSVKYVVFVMRADNDGEGGIMALAALIRRRVTGQRRLVAVAVLLGVIGASLFFGDSVITPAISVLSAVEGLDIVSPGIHSAVLPIGAAILVVLFVVQRFGTHQVGRLFGPVMLLWFVALAVLGVPPIVAHPGVLRGLSPTYAVAFVFDRPYIAFIAMGAVVLAITGAEALYADMGHFGRPPIRRAWFAVVFPALTLNYLGQGALILQRPESVSNPFYLLVPGWARIPMVILATLATVIASQAVISGAFSVARQAMQLGFLPHLNVRHTSREESGQIFVPAVNWLLLAGVLILMFAFRTSASLATAYGLAVTGTLLLTTSLYLVLASSAWHWKTWRLVVFGVVFGGLELTFFAANLTKVVHGGWLPLLLGALVVTVMLTWQRGRRVITAKRVDVEGQLTDFVEDLRAHPPHRVPGTAVFPHPTKETVPLALRANAEFNGVVHEHVVIVSVISENVPHVPRNERVNVDSLDHSDDGIVHLSARFGFQDDQDVQGVLRDAFMLTSELEVDPDTAFYFLSRITIERGRHGGLPNWQKRLFIGLSHNAATPAAYFKLPVGRTIVMGTRIELLSSVYDSTRLAAGYAFDRPPVHAHILASARPHRRARRALDIGCGAGVSTAALASLAEDVIGVEPVATMLTHRRQVAPTAAFVTGTAEALPFAAGSFDLVTAAGSLNYADLRSALPEVARVLTSDGTFLLYDFSQGRESLGDDGLAAWFESFERRFPAPPGWQPLSVRELPLASFGLRLLDHTDVEVRLPMARDAYLRYAVHEVNVDNAIMRGACSEAAAYEWCLSTLSEVFRDADLTVVFHGYLATLGR